MLGIFLDLETNGLDYRKHSVLEISIQILDLSTGEKKGEVDTVVFQDKETFDKADPISLQINGFTYEMLSTGITLSDLNKQIISLFKQLNITRKNAVYICQNPSFDRVFFSQIVPVDTQEDLLWPYHWLDLASMYWKASIASHAYQKSIDELLPLSKDHIAASAGVSPESKPHRAANGTQHLIDCYEKVVGFPNKKKALSKSLEIAIASN